VTIVPQGLDKQGLRGAVVMASFVLHSATAFAATPMTYLQSFGPIADSILSLTRGVLAISIVVVIVMTALVLWAIFRLRPSRR
jgi:hypothetical protein